MRPLRRSAPGAFAGNRTAGAAAHRGATARYGGTEGRWRHAEVGIAGCLVLVIVIFVEVDLQVGIGFAAHHSGTALGQPWVNHECIAGITACLEYLAELVGTIGADLLCAFGSLFRSLPRPLLKIPRKSSKRRAPVVTV